MGDYEQQQQQQPAKHAPTWTPVDRRVAGKLDVSDFRRVADARRELWTGGFIGMLGGLAAGYLGFHVYQRALAPAWLQSKHMVVFTLCGAAAGGYVGSAMRGMASFEGLGDVWERQKSDSYQSRVWRAQAAEAAAQQPEPQRK